MIPGSGIMRLTCYGRFREERGLLLKITFSGEQKHESIIGAKHARFKVFVWVSSDAIVRFCSTFSVSLILKVTAYFSIHC